MSKVNAPEVPGYEFRDGQLFVNGVDKNGSEYSFPVGNGFFELSSVKVMDDGIERKQACVIQPYFNDRYHPKQEVELIDKLQRPDGFRYPVVSRNAWKYQLDYLHAQVKNAPVKKVYTATGWHKQEETGKWMFVLSNGAIGAENITADLSQVKLEQYAFCKEKESDVWATQKKFFEVAPHRITYPLFALIALSPLNTAFRLTGHEPAFGLFLKGGSGNRKSTLAALSLCHFGQFTDTSLPASFSDTKVALEERGFYAKDIPLVVDDLYPPKTRQDKERLADLLEYISRSYGNRRGKAKANSDSSIRTPHAVRGNLIITGEQIPDSSASTRARLFEIAIEKDEVNLTVLSEVQSKSNRLNLAMQEYLKWLAEQYDALPNKLFTDFEAYREKASLSLKGHGRIAPIVSYLYIGILYWLKFMKSTERLSESEADAMLEEVWGILIDTGVEQQASVAREKASSLYITALKELNATGKLQSAIWREDEQYYYLICSATHALVLDYYKAIGIEYQYTDLESRKQLAEAGYIKTHENKNGKKDYTRDKSLPKNLQKPGQGRQAKCLWFFRSVLDAPSDEEDTENEVSS